MDNAYSIAEARNNLSGLVREVEKGRRVKLTRRGKPVAVLIRHDEYARLTHKPEKPDLWAAIQNWRKSVDLDALNFSDEDFDNLRDKRPGRDFKW